MKKLVPLVLLLLLSGCVTPYYCGDEIPEAEYSPVKCGLAVCADIVLVSFVILGAAAAAQGGGSSPSYDESGCDCPYDYDVNGNQCGDRSAWSRPGGRTPICYGVVGD